MYRLKVRLHGQDVKDVALESGREYTFGRGADCDIELEEQPGISRSHFKVYEEAGSWSAQVIAKFGDITVSGRPVKSVQLEVGSVFKVAGYDFLFAEAKVADEEIPMASGDSHSNANLPATISRFSATSPFEGSDEATRVMDIVQSGDPYIRIVESSGREETTKLEGRKWVAGREDGSQILLNDRKASRRQFELIASPQGNFVRDLGSSNGTQLNGTPLAPDELKPLRSGDVIQVGALSIYFEVRDPHFEKRLQIVPKDVLSSQAPPQQHVPFEMINYPVANGPGGAVRVDQSSGVPMSYQGQANDWAPSASAVAAAKKKKFYIVLGAVVLSATVLYSFMGNDKPALTKPPKQVSQGSDGFSRLNPQKQQFVKEAYILGRNLFVQGKQAMASEQFRKIHEILKEGYEDSLGLAAECQAQADQEANRRVIEREMQEAAQNKVIVTENLRKCKPISDSSYNENEIRSCLAPTYERDPNNLSISDYVGKVQARIAAREAKQVNARAYAGRVARGRELFGKAEAIEKRGELDSSVEAYKVHLAANLPDPDGLRAMSQKKVGVIQANKAASIASFMKLAETAFVNHDYKTAVTNINKVKALDAYNTDAAELNGRIQREKDQKLREIYEESVINEGLGQIDQAKTNWKKIIDTDHPDGTYYKRARNKLRAFGGSS